MLGLLTFWFMINKIDLGRGLNELSLVRSTTVQAEIFINSHAEFVSKLGFSCMIEAKLWGLRK